MGGDTEQLGARSSRPPSSWPRPCSRTGDRRTHAPTPRTANRPHYDLALEVRMTRGSREERQERVTRATASTRCCDAPVTRVEPGRTLVVGTWAFVLVLVPGGRTRRLVRQPYPGWIAWWCRPGWACYKCSAARSTTRLESRCTFVMERKMMLVLKQRAEHAGTPARGQPKQLLALSWSTLAFTAGSRAESSMLDNDR